MLPALRPVMHAQQPTLKVDVSEVFASAFLFAAGTPKGLDAKVGFVKYLNPAFIRVGGTEHLVGMSRSEQARKCTRRANVRPFVFRSVATAVVHERVTGA